MEIAHRRAPPAPPPGPSPLSDSVASSVAASSRQRNNATELRGRTKQSDVVRRDEDNTTSLPTSTSTQNAQKHCQLGFSCCAGCSLLIEDRLLLSVAGSSWHVDCLKCRVCSLSLDSFSSCFVKQDSIYCKTCYSQQWGTRCAGCSRSITSSDWVRRARSHVYHIACFACQQCKRQLSTGEEFALQDESRLLCKQHYMELVEGDSGASKAKTKRVRTTFSEEQLAVLQAHFQVDSNPDGADLERIANITGLSKRVTQVWFQNSRARQKKYQGSKKGSGGMGGAGGGTVSSGDDALSPRSAASSEDGLIFPTSVTTSAEEALVGISLQAINYD